MNLCVFLAIGETWEEFVVRGQDSLLIRNNFSAYSKNFKMVYVFAYGAYAGYVLPNVYIVPNKWKLHRFAYALLLPILHRSIVRSAQLIRGMQLTSIYSASVAKLLFRKKIVINYGYDYVWLARFEGKKIRALFLACTQFLLVPFVDAIIVTTKELKQKLHRFESKTHVIPNSVDSTVFKPSKIKKTIDILFTGRLEKQKNLSTLFLALRNCKPRPKVVLVGTGSQEKTLIALAIKYKLKVRIYKSVPHDQLVEYYQKARIFVLPSHLEGHPKSLLEAMSCEVAVIGATSEGIKNLIVHNRNGLLFTSDQELRQQIMLLLQHPRLRQKLGARARVTILTHFDKQATWKKEISLLLALAQ